MTWASIGEKSPIGLWSTYDSPVVGNAVARITTTYSPDSIRYLKRLHFAEVYANSQRRFLFTLPLSSDPTLEPLEIPSIFSLNNLTVRFLQVKTDLFGVAESFGVSVKIEIQYFDNSDEQIAVFDGGIYD